MSTGPVFPNAVTVKSYALTMEEARGCDLRVSQIIRSGGASWRLMRGDRSMACDVDSAGARFGPVEVIKRSVCRLGGYS